MHRPRFSLPGISHSHLSSCAPCEFGMPGPAAHPAAKLLREGTQSLVTAWEKKKNRRPQILLSLGHRTSLHRCALLLDSHALSLDSLPLSSSAEANGIARPWEKPRTITTLESHQGLLGSLTRMPEMVSWEPSGPLQKLPTDALAEPSAPPVLHPP